MRKNKKNILITGVDGFIGYHLAKRLYLDFNIFGIDKNRHLKRIKRSSLKKYYCLNLDNYNKLKILNNFKFDYIFHLGAFSKPSKAELNPESAISSNIIGTINMLKIAKKSRNCRFIFSSAGAIYNNIPKYIPIDEKHSIDPLQSIYAASKRSCEHLINDEIKFNNMNAIYFRLFNTFGPSQDKDFLIPSFINQAKKKNFINIINGKIVRDFNYVDNVIDAFILSMNSSYKGGPINLGTGRGEKIFKIAKIIAKKFDINVKDRRNPNTFGPKVQIVNYNYAKRILNWRPKIGLEEGILKTIKSFTNPNN
jgi:nucleoside-diphosphate-sugar epimerase